MCTSDYKVKEAVETWIHKQLKNFSQGMKKPVELYKK